MSPSKRVAIVTGGNRGIGLETCRQLVAQGVAVVLTARDEAGGQRAVTDLANRGQDASFVRLDVCSADDIAALVQFMRSNHGGVDIVINNAGVSFNGFGATIARETTEINFFGALNVTEALLPIVRPGGRVVMVSSGMGERSMLGEALRERFHDQSLTRDELAQLMQQFIDDVAARRHTDTGWPSSAYCVSKIGMTKLAEILARDMDAQGNPGKILINACCPGWVRTDMGGERADRSVEQGADTPVWLGLLDDSGPQGGFFRDRAPASW